MECELRKARREKRPGFFVPFVRYSKSPGQSCRDCGAEDEGERNYPERGEALFRARNAAFEKLVRVKCGSENVHRDLRSPLNGPGDQLRGTGR